MQRNTIRFVVKTEEKKANFYYEKLLDFTKTLVNPVLESLENYPHKVTFFPKAVRVGPFEARWYYIKSFLFAKVSLIPPFVGCYSIEFGDNEVLFDYEMILNICKHGLELMKDDVIEIDAGVQSIYDKNSVFYFSKDFDIFLEYVLKNRWGYRIDKESKQYRKLHLFLEDKKYLTSEGNIFLIYNFEENSTSKKDLRHSFPSFEVYKFVEENFEKQKLKRALMSTFH